MKLIREIVEDIEYLKEDKEGKESLFIRGTFAQAEVTNRNKRFYPLSILENEIGRFVTEKVNHGSAFGELGHPSGPSINLDRSCILIKEMNRDGNNFIGKAKVTSEGMGRIVKGLINDGAKLGVSTRALGSLKARKDGINEVQDDFKLLAVDVVADPSAPDAYVTGIMENVEYFWDAAHGTWGERTIEEHRETVKKLSIREIEEQKLRMWKQFLSSLTAN